MHSLHCGGCPYSTKLHNQWGAFELEVDYVVPLAARQLGVSSDVNGTMTEDCSSSNYMLIIYAYYIAHRNYESPRCKTLNSTP